MSNRIYQLSDSVKNMIAAGEVVEGPFSVLKELIENSIDAKASDIYIEIEESGFKKILVRDNGDGIYKDDIPKAILEHATSKITDIKDIDNILSYGFRGEALSSISSISKLTILSRTEEESIGAKLIKESENQNLSDYAGPTGTTVIVENLFYNTPARKKFLKSKSGEARIIKETFNKIALAHPEISFTLVINEKKPYMLSAVKDESKRIEQVFTKGDQDSLYYDEVSDFNVEISGYFSKPDYLKGSRKMQYLYVNKRPIDYKHLGFLLTRAYDAIAPKGKYPAAIIYVKIKPDLVDVNIHPAKREIKFFDYKYIESLIYGLVKKVLSSQEHQLDISNYGEIEEQVASVQQAVSVKKSIDSTNYSSEDSVSANKELYKNEQLFDSKPEFRYDSSANKLNTQSSDNEEEFISDRNIVKDSEAIYHEINKNIHGNILGVVFGTYILVEIDNSLKVIDFHAAHERMKYDEIMEDDFKFEIQELLFPETIELSSSNYDLFLEYKSYFQENGIDVDEISDTAIIVRGIPDFLIKTNINEFISDLFDTLSNQKNMLDEIKTRIAERMACHSAKRANDNLTVSDMQILVEKCFSGKYELRCPHGRPFVFKLDKKDFEKMFKR